MGGPETRRQQIEAYQRRPVRQGVFGVRCSAGGPTYLGTATDLDTVWNRHRFQLDLGAHRNRGLQAAWQEWGADAFVVQTVSELTYPDDSPHDLRGDLAALLALCLEDTAQTFVKIE